MALARQEAHVSRVGPHVQFDDLDRTVDQLLGPAALLQDRAHQHVQAGERLLDQGDAEVGEIAEVPVEPRRGHPGGPGHLADAEAGEVLRLQQAQARVHQRAPALLLLGLSDPHTVTHVIQ